MHSLLLPSLARLIQLAGVAFLLYMAWKLAVDDGRLNASQPGHRPTMTVGAVMQWLNPKAWLACVAGVGAFVANGEAYLVWQFAAVYFVICYGSIACWAFAGTFLRHSLDNPRGMRLFNRVMALLLALSAVYLMLP